MNTMIVGQAEGLMTVMRQSIAAVCAVATIAFAGCGGSDENDPTEATDQREVAADTPPPADIFALGELANYLDQSNAESVALGLTASASSNYGVWSGLYQPEECIASTKRAAGYLVGARFEMKFMMNTAAEAPDAVPAEFRPVQGRAYTVDTAVTISNRETGQILADVLVPFTAVVVPDGNAKWVGRCR